MTSVFRLPKVSLVAGDAMADFGAKIHLRVALLQEELLRRPYALPDCTVTR
jgi:hypothetical protein